MPFDKTELVNKIKTAGIVGAGGAGFPSYVKANSQCETVILNAAECEPLLKKDQIILDLYSEEVIKGMYLLMQSTGARRGIIGIKKKHEKLIEKLEKICSKTNISVFKLGDFYPAGDEFCLVYETTGKVIAPGEIPLNVGCVVNNVETVYNIALSDKKPVIEKFITITGAVKKPATIKVPVGITFSQAIEFCGGFTVKNPAAIDGGPMMGKVITDFENVVTKTSAGLIVLPLEHPLIKKKSQQQTQFTKIGRSACDQCSLCTELCPRYMLGHLVQPHKVMRSLLFSAKDSKIHSEFALLCCECSLCSLYSCPEGLNPREVCIYAKANLKEMKINLKNSSLSPILRQVHPLREFRKTPVKKLIKKLNLSDYDKPAPYMDFDYKPKKVKILLSQHIGSIAKPIVKLGDFVKKGDIIGEIENGALGCPVHSSIDGKIVNLNDRYVEIEA
jgi:Na+-translocating ferredoxin:NAD+ oxidoreductase RnfC subunit